MPSRFSPGVAPYVGRSFTQHLADALQQGMAVHQQRKAQQAAEQERAESEAIRDLTLAQQGIRRGTAPAEAPVMQAGVPMATQFGTIPTPARAPERFTQITDRFYRDNNVVREQQEQARQATLADALFKARIPQMADPEGFALDRRKTEAEIRALETPKPQPPVRLGTVTTDEGVFAFNPVTGQMGNRLGSRPKPQTKAGTDGQGPGKPPSEGERRAAALHAVAKDAFGVLENSKPPSRIEAGVSRLGMNEGLSQQRQLVNQAARQFATSYLYIVSGATASPQEVENLAKQIEDQPGDKPETTARKRQARATMMQAMETMGGRAVVPSAPTPSATPAVPSTANPWRR